VGLAGRGSSRNVKPPLMLIQFACPHCQQVLELESVWAGHPVACPSCGAQVTAPAPQALLAAKVPVSTPPRRTPTGPGDHKVRGGGGGFFKFLLLMFLLAAGGFLSYCYSTHLAPAAAWQQGVDLARQYLSPAPPPAPVPAPKPIPAPVVVAPAPKPAPATNVVIVAPPPPPPPPPDPLA